MQGCLTCNLHTYTYTTHARTQPSTPHLTSARPSPLLYRHPSPHPLDPRAAAHAPDLGSPTCWAAVLVRTSPAPLLAATVSHSVLPPAPC
eukprot:1159840-Pelagomonas_calceolata.AAC.6